MQDWKDKWPEWVTPSGQMKRTLTSSEKTEVFIHRAKQVHGDSYDYSLAVYKGAKVKLELGCAEHGVFFQTPDHHINQKNGCPKCFGNHGKYTTESWVAKAKEVHGTKYTYSKVTYVAALSNVVITCPSHGDFEQRAAAHLTQAQGCPKCSGGVVLSTEEWVAKARAVHGDTYTYANVNYVNARTGVTITCREHGDFEQNAHDHTQGKGCPKCAGHNQDVLYCLRVKGTDYYKVGITTGSYTRRFPSLKNALWNDQNLELEFVAEATCDNPRELETKIHALEYPNPFATEQFDGSTEYRLIPDIHTILKEYF